MLLYFIHWNINNAELLIDHIIDTETMEILSNSSFCCW